MSVETQQKIKPSQIVKLDKAFKLAEQWVNGMSKAMVDDTEAEPEGRPARLGLGAKVVRQPKVGSLNDPVERKLHAKLEAGKRKSAKSMEELLPSTGERHNVNNNVDDDDSDEELESRTKAFTKKRVGPPDSSLQDSSSCLNYKKYLPSCLIAHVFIILLSTLLHFLKHGVLLLRYQNERC